jgi:hypothetical protein
LTAGQVSFGVRIDSARVEHDFKAAQREIKRKAAEGIKEAGQREMLPPVKRRAPAVIAHSLTTKATSTRGYVTTLGSRKADRITGLLNFGGTVKAPIKPKKKQALMIGKTGEFRAVVTKPRHYRGKHFIERGLEEGFSGFEQRVLVSIMGAFGSLDHSP